MAEITSLTALKQGTLSFKGRVVLSGGANDTIANAKLVALINSGPLNTLFDATYADAAAVDAAFEAAGVETIVQAESGAGVATLAFIWTASTSTVSATLVCAAAAGTFLLTVRQNHSIIQ